MYHRWMALRLVVLSCLACLARAQTFTVCPSISGEPTCVCQHPDGIINLTSLANPPPTSGNLKPRFTGVKDPNDWLYSFNPCYTYSEQTDCQNVYICQSKATITGQFKVATGNEQIRTDPDDKVYLFYTGDGQRTVNVFLHCNQSVTEEESAVVTTLGDSTQLYYYVFDVHSCHACPGGCVAASVDADIAGPIGLVLIFFFLGAVVAYFIVGAIIMRVKYQATGTDLIPNKNIWFEIPSLIKGGCVLTFGPCVTLIREKVSGQGYSKM